MWSRCFVFFSSCLCFSFSLFFLNWTYPNVKTCNLENWFSIHALHCAALGKYACLCHGVDEFEIIGRLGGCV